MTTLISSHILQLEQVAKCQHTRSIRLINGRQNVLQFPEKFTHVHKKILLAVDVKFAFRSILKQFINTCQLCTCSATCCKFKFAIFLKRFNGVATNFRNSSHSDLNFLYLPLSERNTTWQSEAQHAKILTRLFVIENKRNPRTRLYTYFCSLYLSLEPISFSF